MVPNPFQLETPRLLIRELVPEDIGFLAEMLADPEVMRYWPRPLDREEAQAWLEKHRTTHREHGRGYWLAVRKEDGAPIGQVGLLNQTFDGSTVTGLGYMLHRPFWGQGYACEGSKECLRYGFEELGLEKIAVLIRPENEPSLALLHRLGGHLTGECMFAELKHLVFEVKAKSR